MILKILPTLQVLSNLLESHDYYGNQDELGILAGSRILTPMSNQAKTYPRILQIWLPWSPSRRHIIIMGFITLYESYKHQPYYKHVCYICIASGCDCSESPAGVCCILRGGARPASESLAQLLLLLFSSTISTPTGLNI